MASKSQTETHRLSSLSPTSRCTSCSYWEGGGKPRETAPLPIQNGQSTNGSRADSKALAHGTFPLDTFRTAWNVVIFREKRHQEIRRWRQTHERRMRVTWKRRKSEWSAWRALMQTPFLSFLPFLNNVTVHTNSHLVLSNLPHHENNTKILCVGQNKGQTSGQHCLQTQQEHCCPAVWLAGTSHFSGDIFLSIGLSLQGSTLLSVACLLKTLLRDLLILGIHSWLRQGGNQKLLELGKGNWWLWALHAGPLLGKWVLVRSFMLHNSFSFSNQPPDSEKVSRSKRRINSFFKGSCLFHLGELSVPACSSSLSSSNWYWQSAPLTTN